MTAGRSRPWWISPFNQGKPEKRLPPMRPDGLPRLVAQNGEVSLTATRRARSAQPIIPSPGDISLAELGPLFAPTGPTMNGGAFSISPPRVEALDPLWCAAFDDKGTLRGSWREPRAFRVVA